MLLEKLIVSKLVSKFPAIFGPRNFITVRSALFWSINQPTLISPYRRFEKTLEDRSDNLSRNLGTLRYIPEDVRSHLLRNGSLKPRLPYRVNNGLLLTSILPQINAVNATPFYFSKTHFNIKFLSTPTYCKRWLPFTFSIKTLYNFLFSPSMPHAPPVLSSLIMEKE